MKKKPSLKDIASKVGVSTALVSYVLNGKMEGRISKEVASRIKEVAKELNYRPNQIARSLKTNKTNSIGLLLADISNPFSSQIARIIENEADRMGYAVIIGSSDEDIEKSEKIIDVFLNRQVDGLILSLPDNSEHIVSNLKSKDIPFVLLDRYFPGIPTNTVAVDNYSASEDVVKHLMEKKYKNVGIVSYDTSLVHLNERLRGATEQLNGHSKVGKVRLGHIQEDVESSIDSFLKSEPSVDAIFFTSNLLTISGLKYLNSKEVIIPRDLGVIAFDKTDAFDLFYTSITYVNQPLPQLGKEAVRLIIQAISDNKKKEQIFLSAELIVRDSTSRK
ncbi:LacI family DNA-binding transcriptional regulator [Plebeiibacterium marinum]|uniref:LacI family DNA-binding transcriptional regulator n=1 Tax=Plebeiibacterium marinum TaxID=2992111 RepID=A0AAE3SKF6_9BACT|nr:LacI family DNA-binding transcriptional regulator [Plebeiobacterium marinum]MCW3806810.1 LacI family DNA-binding transcriptional regulator [Plebeiobacterium marinum]